MAGTLVTNREFRDLAAESLYPFQDSATMTSDEGLVVPAGWALDALVYPPYGYSPPYRVSKLSWTRYSTAEAMLVELEDSSGTPVASGYALLTSEIAHLTTPDGVHAGSILQSVSALAPLLGSLERGSRTFGATAMPLLPSRCSALPRTHLVGFLVEGRLIGGDVTIRSSKGVTFTGKPDGEPFTRIEISADPNDEDFDGTAPRYVKTINNTADVRNYKISSAPESALRVVNNSDAVWFKGVMDAG
jgi:hypothetical protein